MNVTNLYLSPTIQLTEDDTSLILKQGLELWECNDKGTPSSTDLQ